METKHSGAVSLLFYLHKPNSGPCRLQPPVYLHFGKNCQTGILTNSRSPRSTQGPLAARHVRKSRRCGLRGAGGDFCALTVSNARWECCSFFCTSFPTYSSSVCSLSLLLFYLYTTKKQQALKVNMETQLFIHLKYWYELTGQQYSPTHTF